jgi:hypothetical protein
MPRYYDMDKLKQMIESRADTLIEGKEAFLYVAKWLDSLPAADVVPAAIGEWLENEAGCKCSHCGWQGYGEHDSECMPLFCPECFARMYSKFDGEEYAKVESFRLEKEARLVRNIFAEIERLIELTAFADCWSEGGFKNDIAKLKKKYEGEQKSTDCELTDTEIIQRFETYADYECDRCFDKRCDFCYVTLAKEIASVMRKQKAELAVLKMKCTEETADVVTRSEGEWIAKGTMIRTPSAKNYTCSACDYDSAITTPYCPNCGAKMKGGAE